jgi:hypothetical protein
MATQQQDNQKLQNTANQRSEELKPYRHVTGAGETSSSASASRTNVDGRVGTDADSGARDVETFNAADRSRDSNITDDIIGGSSAGGVAGTGGVSTNDVGPSRTSKNPLLER